MKILQLNAWGGRLEIQILSLLEQEQPDIICLQEAISMDVRKSGGFFVTVEIIAREMGMHLSYAPVAGFKFMSRDAEIGNAILSKRPFESQHTVFTRMQYVKDFDIADDDYNIRNLHHVTIFGDQGPLNILTHHGHHVPTHKNGDEETERQCKVIADYVSGIKGQVILTGDFNLAPHSASLEQVNKVLHNICIEHDVDTTRTELTPKNEVCDYIFRSDDVVERDFRVLDAVVSDHRALTMKFD